MEPCTINHMRLTDQLNHMDFVRKKISVFYIDMYVAPYLGTPWKCQEGRDKATRITPRC